MDLFTEEQTIKLLESYNVDTILPKKGEKKVISFPKDPERFQFRYIEIKLSDIKSTYGKKLYSFEFQKWWAE